MLVLVLARVSSRVSGFPVASPCLWGKPQNLSFSKVAKQVVMSFCVAGVALCDSPTCFIPCRKCQNWRKSRTKCSFCCSQTAIRGSHERLRTVANGCGRERNVERTHPQPPDPQSETGTLATHSGMIKKIKLTCSQQYPRHLPNAWSRKQPLQQRQTRARRDWWQDTTFLSPSFILQHWCHSSHATQGHV